MKQKTAIRYLRISADKQSNYSISGQDMQTQLWCERNGIEVVDTFVDEGYSARTFDRPDMIRLNAFIEQHYKLVDYLVVFDFTRFSRDTGEALIEVKRLQGKYQIKIASAGEGVIVDYDDPGSFFYAGLRFLQGEDEINRNRARVNLGIYTAKKKEGRYLGRPPVGYKTQKDGRKTIIVIDEEPARIIRFIYTSFLEGTPIYIIYKKAREMGLKLTGKSTIPYILKNPVYTGLLQVKAYKENPEELVEGIHEPLVSRYEWNQVQEKLKPGKPLQIIHDDFPLRSVLLCHCGKPLTGAPSRGHCGKYFNYYKCRISGHNNINANFAHQQMLQLMEYLSLPERLITVYSELGEQMLEQEVKQSAIILKQKKKEFETAEKNLISVEKKWIANQLAFETYQRWYRELSQQKMSLKAEMDQLTRGKQTLFILLEKELKILSDMKYVYTSCTTTQKQQLLRLVFDARLYYKDKVYRTPYIMPVFDHNSLTLKEKRLLILDKKIGLSSKVRSSADDRGRTYMPCGARS